MVPAGSCEAFGSDVTSEEEADSTGAASTVSVSELTGLDGLVSEERSPEACFLSEASSPSTGAGRSLEEGADTFSTGREFANGAGKSRN